jgi:hypothetical protein
LEDKTLFKILARLGQLVRLADQIDDLIEIGVRFKMAEAEIRGAVTGTEVDCGTVKGIKAFGRRFDLPLKPILRG